MTRPSKLKISWRGGKQYTSLVTLRGRHNNEGPIKYSDMKYIKYLLVAIIKGTDVPFTPIERTFSYLSYVVLISKTEIFELCLS